MISMLVPAALGSAGLLLCAPTSGVGRLTTPRHRWVARLGGLVRNHPYQLAIGGVVVGAATVGQHFPTLVAAVFAGGTAMMMLRRMRARRQAAWQRAESATMLTLIVGELQAGATMGAALTACLPTLTEPELRREITVAARRCATGGSAGAELEQSPILALSLMGHAWRIAETNGMALAGVLDNIRHRIDHQNRHESRTKAALQGANATAIVLALLPLLGMVMGHAIGVNVPAFLTSGGVGGLILIAGVSAECAGILWSDHIIQKAHSCSSSVPFSSSAPSPSPAAGPHPG